MSFKKFEKNMRYKIFSEEIISKETFTYLLKLLLLQFCKFKLKLPGWILHDQSFSIIPKMCIKLISTKIHPLYEYEKY